MSKDQRNEKPNGTSREPVQAWLDPEQIDALDRLARHEDSSRSAQIRRAVKGYLRTKGSDSARS
jgi:predicted transcriptional regulator